jgi:hypothetical protein
MDGRHNRESERQEAGKKKKKKAGRGIVARLGFGLKRI